MADRVLAMVGRKETLNVTLPPGEIIVEAERPVTLKPAPATEAREI